MSSFFKPPGSERLSAAPLDEKSLMLRLSAAAQGFDFRYNSVPRNLVLPDSAPDQFMVILSKSGVTLDPLITAGKYRTTFPSLSLSHRTTV